MRKNTIGMIAGLAMIAAGSLAANTALAEEEPLKLSVSYGDLNLASDEGLDRLRSRIKRAGKEACGVPSLFELGSVRAVQDAKACYRMLVEPALAQAEAIASTRLANSSPEPERQGGDASAAADPTS